MLFNKRLNKQKKKSQILNRFKDYFRNRLNDSSENVMRAKRKPSRLGIATMSQLSSFCIYFKYTHISTADSFFPLFQQFKAHHENNLIRML